MSRDVNAEISLESREIESREEDLPGGENTGVKALRWNG